MSIGPFGPPREPSDLIQRSRFRLIAAVQVKSDGCRFVVLLQLTRRAARVSAMGRGSRGRAASCRIPVLANGTPHLLRASAPPPWSSSLPAPVALVAPMAGSGIRGSEPLLPSSVAT